MGRYRPDGVLIVGGNKITVDAPIVNWENSRWDALSTYCVSTETEAKPACTDTTGGQFPYGLPSPYLQRYALRPALRSFYRDGQKYPKLRLQDVQAVIKQFVIHHDGCVSSDMCWNVLQNERGLSCHFLIDNDGTIYQTCDLAIMAYHASEWNVNSIGVELCNRGDAKKEPTYYSRHGVNRPVKPCKINNNTILSFDFTAEQYDSMTKLARALQRVLPNLPAEYPQTSAGVQSWQTMPTSATFSYSGYIGHYHLTNQKWDPGPFDFKEFCRKLRGAFCYPIVPKESAQKNPGDQPTIPTEPSELKAGTEELYKANEQRADGGFFPVGPWGEARLWHGGVHLATKERAPVYAPFPGRLLAARMGPPTAIGSTNFVLLRHDMTLGTSRVEFFSLYMHLMDSSTPSKDQPAPGWLGSKAWTAGYKPNQVVLLDEPIEAGSVIGYVGKAGPADLARAQIHVEFFSQRELFVDVKGSPWTAIDGSAGGRFCESPEINDLIDTDKDGTLSRQELASFYAGGGASATRYMITYHVSEWTADPPWGEALRVPKDFKKWKAADIDQLVSEQIAPGLWWDAAVAAHCKLPTDGVVHHYHPVAFVGWFNQQLLDAAQQAGPSGAINASDAHEVPPGITDDREGGAMKSNVEEGDDPCNTKLTLKEMVLGFDGPAECLP